MFDIPATLCSGASKARPPRTRGPIVTLSYRLPTPTAVALARLSRFRHAADRWVPSGLAPALGFAQVRAKRIRMAAQARRRKAKRAIAGTSSKAVMENVATLSLPLIASVHVTAVAFHPSGTMLAAGDSHGLLRLFSVATGEVIQVLDVLHEGRAAQRHGQTAEQRAVAAECTDVAFSPSGAFLASCHRSGRVVVMRTAVFAERVFIEAQAPGGLTSIPASTMRLHVWDAPLGSSSNSSGGGGGSSGLPGSTSSLPSTPTAGPHVSGSVREPAAAFVLMVDGESTVGMYHVRRVAQSAAVHQILAEQAAVYRPGHGSVPQSTPRSSASTSARTGAAQRSMRLLAWRMRSFKAHGRCAGFAVHPSRDYLLLLSQVRGTKRGACTHGAGSLSHSFLAPLVHADWRSAGVSTVAW